MCVFMYVCRRRCVCSSFSEMRPWLRNIRLLKFPTNNLSLAASSQFTFLPLDDGEGEHEHVLLGWHRGWDALAQQISVFIP